MRNFIALAICMQGFAMIGFAAWLALSVPKQPSVLWSIPCALFLFIPALIVGSVICKYIIES